MSMSFDTFYNLPITYRRWFIERLRKLDNPEPDNSYDDMDTPLLKR